MVLNSVTVAKRKANNIQGYSHLTEPLVLVVYPDYATWLLQMVLCVSGEKLVLKTATSLTRRG